MGIGDRFLVAACRLSRTSPYETSLRSKLRRLPFGATIGEAERVGFSGDESPNACLTAWIST